MADETVRIEGLLPFRNALKDVALELPKELRAGLKTIADLVAQKTRSAFEGGVGVAPKVAPSVKALAQQTGASIRIGGPAYPFAMGAEFGGGKFETGRPSPHGGYTTQFPAWRGSGSDAGYQLYPTVRAEQDHLADDVADLMHQLTSKAFPN